MSKKLQQKLRDVAEVINRCVVMSASDFILFYLGFHFT